VLLLSTVTVNSSPSVRAAAVGGPGKNAGHRTYQTIEGLIPAIASALPVVEGTVILSTWPKHRYDVVWTFTLVPDAATTRYAFGQIPQIPQLLLSGDATP
jgi:hypothetical protein